MPPFYVTAILQPHLEIRQKAQQTPYYVVLSITRLTTTYTTTIDLSPSTASNPSSPATTTQATSSAPTTASAAATSSSSLSGGSIAGIVLGTIIGFFILATILYKCCWSGESITTYRPWGSYYSSSYYSDEEFDDGVEVEEINVRGGGGDDWYRSHYGVRRPCRARVRRERMGEWKDRKGVEECFEVVEEEEVGYSIGRRRKGRYEGNDGCHRHGRRDRYDGWTSSIDGCWLLCCGGGRPRRRVSRKAMAGWGLEPRGRYREREWCVERRRKSCGSGWADGGHAYRGRVVCTIDD